MKIRGKNVNMVEKRLEGESRKHYLRYLRKEYRKYFPFDKEKDNIIIYNYQLDRAVRKMEKKSYEFYYDEDGVNFRTPSMMETIKYAFTPSKKFKRKVKKAGMFFKNTNDKIYNFFASKLEIKGKVKDEDYEEEIIDLDKSDCSEESFEEEYLEENLHEDELINLDESDYLEENLHEEQELKEPKMGIEIVSSRDLTPEEKYELKLKEIHEYLNDYIKEQKKYIKETNKKIKNFEETINRLREENLKLRKDYKTLAINSKCIIIRNIELEQERKEKLDRLNSMFDNYLINSGNNYINNDLTVKEMSNEKVKILTK